MAVSLTSTTVEMEFSGVGAGWTTVPDVRMAGNTIQCGYGIRGSGPTDRVADPGTLTLALDNVSNSGNKIGYYSPNNANVRSGFKLGIRVRISWTYSGVQYFKFIGTIDRIQPAPGKTPRLSIITVVDWMDEAARYQVQGVPAVISTSANAVLTAVLAAIPKQPNATSFGTGSDTYPYAPAAGATEQYTALSELQRVAMSELGIITMRGGTTGAAASTLTFISRAQLVQSPYNTSQGTFTDSMIGMDDDVSRGSVLNVFRTTVHPARFDPLSGSPVVLFTYGGKPPVDPGATITILGQYSDPAQLASRVSGYSMIAPIVGTDILINSNADGSGTDLSGSFTVTTNYGSDGVTYQVTNGGAVTGFVAFLQARGFGIYDYSQIEVEKRDATSVTAYGESPVALDMAYQSDTTFGANVGAYLLPYWKDPTTIVQSVTFFANDSNALMLQALGREPGDVITIVESTTGVNKLFRIQAVDLTQADKLLYCTWTLSQMVDVTDYWVLEEVGSALGTNTVVAL